MDRVGGGQRIGGGEEGKRKEMKKERKEVIP